MIPSIIGILYPEARVPVPEARAILRPVLTSAIHSGMSLFDFYYGVVAKTTVTMTTHDFFGWAGRVESHLQKAIAPGLQDPSEPFLISRLPQEKCILPDRFWGRFEVTLVDRRGNETTKWTTYGFNEKMPVGELEDDVADYVGEFYPPEDQKIKSVSLSELYKRW